MCVPKWMTCESPLQRWQWCFWLSIYAKACCWIIGVTSHHLFLLCSHKGYGKPQRTKDYYNSYNYVFFYPYVHNFKLPLKCLCISDFHFLNATTWNLNDFQGEPWYLLCKHWPARQYSYSRVWNWPLWHSVFKVVTPELSLSMDKHTGH